MPAAATRVAQAELVFPDLVSQFDAGDGDRCCRDGLEAVHGQASSLDGSVILLDDVVQILAGSNLDVAPKEGFTTQQPERPSARDMPIERDFAGTATVVGCHGFSEEGLGSSDTPVWPEQEVDRPPLLVHGPIQDHLPRICTYISSTRQELPVGRRSRPQRLSNSGTKRCTQRQIVDG
jgi:hypothetical protein